MMNVKKYSIILGIFILLIAAFVWWHNFSNQAPQENAAAQEQASSATTPTPPKDKTAELLKRMTLEEEVGQLFLVRVPAQNAGEDIQTWHPGGLVMFGRDFDGETPNSLTQKIADWQSLSNLPLFIASDEEGGEVTRISRADGLVPSVYQSQQTLYHAGGTAAVAADASTKAQQLRAYGINLNLAPVADLAYNADSFIYSRTVGQDRDTTAAVIAAEVAAMRTGGTGSCLKHFPGYGDNADSHGEMVHDSRPFESFENNDFVVFQAGIDAGADSVLITHNIVESIDPEHPASISTPIHNILRQELGFTGVIITDDFDMKGLSDFIDQNDAAIDAVNSGGDMIISSSYAEQIPAVLAAVQDGRIAKDTLDSAVTRILKMKENLGLL